MSMETNPPRQHGERSLDEYGSYDRQRVIARTLGPATESMPVDDGHRPDLSRYAFAFRGNGTSTPWETDLVHLMMLWEVMAAVTPVRIVEVGSFQGASTSLWIEALNRGLCTEVHLYEIKPTPSLLKVIGMARNPGRVVLHQQSYYECPLPAGFTFIDADHGWPGIADLCAALAVGSPVIAMHDTTGYEQVPLADCWGSYVAANILRQAPGYRVYEDSARRTGAYTHRGLMIAKKEDYS